MQIPVMAKNAHGKVGAASVLQSAGIVMSSAATDTAITAYSGTLSRFRRLNSHQPGIPRSRENAYQVREALVSPAAPQNSCPTVTMIRISFAAHRSPARALVTIEFEAPPASLTAADVGGREQERQQHEPADHRRPEHRAPHALRRRDRGAARLLGGVGGGVVAGLRVHRQQEALRHDQEPEGEAGQRSVAEADEVELLREDEVGVLVIVGEEDEQAR